jgi:hypothetical protein
MLVGNVDSFSSTFLIVLLAALMNPIIDPTVLGLPPMADVPQQRDRTPYVAVDTIR